MNAGKARQGRVGRKASSHCVMRKSGLRAAGRLSGRGSRAACGRLLSGAFLSAVHCGQSGVFAARERSGAAVGAAAQWVQCCLTALPMPEATVRYREVMWPVS